MPVKNAGANLAVLLVIKQCRLELVRSASGGRGLRLLAVPACWLVGANGNGPTPGFVLLASLVVRRNPVGMVWQSRYNVLAVRQLGFKALMPVHAHNVQSTRYGNHWHGAVNCPAVMSTAIVIRLSPITGLGFSNQAVRYLARPSTQWGITNVHWLFGAVAAGVVSWCMACRHVQSRYCRFGHRSLGRFGPYCPPEPRFRRHACLSYLSSCWRFVCMACPTSNTFNNTI